MKEYAYKILFLGESGTGAKISLINQIIDNEFDERITSSNCTYYVSIFIKKDLGIIKLDLWDTAWQEKYRAITIFFVKGSHCIILGYDITRKDSFNEIKNYHYNNIKNIIGDESLIYLVANKVDLFEKEEVSDEEAINYATEKGLKYFRVSAKTGEGIHELLEDITNSLIMKFQRKKDNEDKNLIKEITNDETKIKNLNVIKEIAKNETEINRLNFKEKIEFILKKYYNY